MTGSTNSHGVVIGASMAGLAAAAALSVSCDRVTVLDRDMLPDAPDVRKGVPQARHVHGLLASGTTALEDLLPGLTRELLRAGALTGDPLAELRWYLDGHLLKQAPSGLTGVLASRRLLEYTARTRVEGLRGVRIRDGFDVDGLTAEGGRVTGVRGNGENVAADLVVDASGRGSRAPHWLTELGFPAPAVTKVRADANYLTRHFQYEEGMIGGAAGALMAPYPGHKKMGVMLRQENDTIVAGIGGILGQAPPDDDAGMLEFARTLPGPEIAEVFREAKPLDQPVAARFPASVRHRYEKLPKYLDGFLVTGDAIGSFDPVYGQGMSVAAMQAVALRDLLASGSGTTDSGGAETVGLPRRWFRAAAKITDRAWMTAVGNDLRFGEVEGKRQPGAGMINRYLERYRAAATGDPVLSAAMVRAGSLVDPPAKLLAPPAMLRVIRARAVIT